MKIFASSRLLKGRDIGDGLELVREVGYDGLEIWYERLVEMDDRQIEQIGKSGLELSLHAASRDLNLTSTNPAVREVAVEEVMKSIDYAARLEAGTVVVHPGRLSSSKDNPQNYFERQLSGLTEIAQYGLSKNCRVVVENMENTPYELVVSPGDLEILVREIGYDLIGICLDFAHATQVQKPRSFLGGGLKPFIDEIHLSNTTKESTHVPMDEGEVSLDLKSMSFMKGFEGPIVIEGYSPRRTSEEMLEAGVGFFKKNLTLEL